MASSIQECANSITARLFAVNGGAMGDRIAIKYKEPDGVLVPE